MTKEELAKAMIEYLRSLDDVEKDESYDTRRGFSWEGVYGLAEHLGISLPGYPYDPEEAEKIRIRK